MRILIVSDTHGYNEDFYEVLKKTGEPDLLIHAGDLQGLEKELPRLVKCDIQMVSGNNDFSLSLKQEQVFDVEGYRFLLTHGHREGVYYGTDRLLYKAMQYEANVVVFGHTHKPVIEYDNDSGIWLINPGSLTFPRQLNRKPSFILADIDRQGEIHFTINYL